MEDILLGWLVSMMSTVLAVSWFTRVCSVIIYERLKLRQTSKNSLVSVRGVQILNSRY